MRAKHDVLQRFSEVAEQSSAIRTADGAREMEQKDGERAADEADEGSERWREGCGWRAGGCISECQTICILK